MSAETIGAIAEGASERSAAYNAAVTLATLLNSGSRDVAELTAAWDRLDEAMHALVSALVGE